ncbi:hypothetical protein ACIRP0_26370 [Streptomyces sp. NPDC101733]|uniref:hypothetical protein n=1 Tax=unclassified Streptomyces TaxID=2593676 RepID=UPI003811407A
MSLRAGLGRLFGSEGPGAVPGRPAEGDASLAEATATLGTNMEAIAGDFSLEGIRSLGSPVATHVSNGGGSLLELWLEPFGQDYWLRPGETFVVTSYGKTGDGAVFEVVHEPERIQVWATSFFATVTFPDGTEVPGGHQRPREEH